MEPMSLYLVNWGNGFVGGYDSVDYTQVFNTSTKFLWDDLMRMNVKEFYIITPEDLDRYRGYHKPSMGEYFGYADDDEMNV